MTKSFHAAWIYAALGLLAGLFYRTYTQAKDYEGATQLSVTHTHLLSLGMLFFLVVMALAAVLPLDGQRHFTTFFWLYNAGVGLTISLMFVRGTLQANGNQSELPAIAGIAGMGHMIITGAIVLFFVVLKGALAQRQSALEPA